MSHDDTDTCEKCGCAIDFPYEWCVCGLPEKQRIQLEKASLQWFVRDNKPPAPEMPDCRLCEWLSGRELCRYYLFTDIYGKCTNGSEFKPAEPIRLYTAALNTFTLLARRNDMKQTLLERLKWWICDTFGHRKLRGRTWLHAENAHRDCNFCGRIATITSEDKT